MRLAIMPLAAAVALSAACSQTPPPPAAKQKTVFEDQLKALDKAKGVQQTVDQQKKDADKKLDENESAR